MRSIATPKEIIDMMTRMNAIALATSPMSPHILIRSISPILLRYRENFRTTSAFPHYCRSLQREVHGDRHDDRHRHAVQQGRCELPLLDGVESRLIEQRD